MFGEYAGVRLMSNPPYPYRIAGRGPAGPDGSPLMTSIRTAVPSLDEYVTCRVVTAGTETRPGAVAQVRHRRSPRVEPQHHRRRRVVGVPRTTPRARPRAAR